MKSQSSTVRLETELRKLRPAELYTLGQILNVSDSWKKLMAIVPKDDSCKLPKFNIEHFSMIEQAAQQQRRCAAEIFLSEWGTMGKNRPTLRTLLDLLVKAELFRAADYLAKDILNEELPKRPECGPAAPVDISDELIKKLLEESDVSENIEFNESLIFSLPSETNNETVNPNAMQNKMNNSSLERNMQSTKLISSKGKHNENLGNVDEILNAQMSDLMKFSSEQNIEQEQVFRQQELSSRDLPAVLNDFGQSGQANINQEVLSDELPVFLNNSMSESNKSSYDDSMNDSLPLSSSNINQNEMVSADLPQCVMELNGNDTFNSGNIGRIKNAAQNVLASQELPITVLEYNNE